jgi:nucleoside-diphosphate-sugar epimerase
MEVLIVGGTGLISQSIVWLLLKQGHEVTCFNRGETGILPSDVRHLQGDRRDRETFENNMRKKRFDAVIDMISFTAEDAQSSLRAFSDAGHFVFCSTTCTYGIDFDEFPVKEDHPLRPITGYGKGKVAAEHVFLSAHHGNGYPVTIIRPSTTYGAKGGMLRQIAWEFSWIDRIRRGKPIVVCGDGNALHQYLHIDDAAKGFAGVLGKSHCVGQTYNLVKKGCLTWAEYHKTAMKVLGREVELVGVPLRNLVALETDRYGICKEIFAHHCYYDSEKLFRDVPEFQPSISLEEGMTRVIAEMDSAGRIPVSDDGGWEDQLIQAQSSGWDVRAE